MSIQAYFQGSHTSQYPKGYNMTEAILGSIAKQKDQNNSTRPEGVKDNELISLYMTSTKSDAFLGYFQTPDNFVEKVIEQLATANITAVVADSEAKTERQVPVF